MGMRVLFMSLQLTLLGANNFGCHLALESRLFSLMCLYSFISLSPGTYGNAWCPDPKDKQPFVEIHLDKPVSIGEIDIQAPTISQTTFQYPENYMKTFDLVIKLAGINQLVRVAQVNKFISFLGF